MNLSLTLTFMAALFATNATHSLAEGTRRAASISAAAAEGNRRDLFYEELFNWFFNQNRTVHGAGAGDTAKSEMIEEASPSRSPTKKPTLPPSLPPSRSPTKKPTEPLTPAKEVSDLSELMLEKDEDEVDDEAISKMLAIIASAKAEADQVDATYETSLESQDQDHYVKAVLKPGIVGDAGVSLLVGMILILIFAEALGLYLIDALILSQNSNVDTEAKAYLSSIQGVEIENIIKEFSTQVTGFVETYMSGESNAAESIDGDDIDSIIQELSLLMTDGADAETYMSGESNEAESSQVVASKLESVTYSAAMILPPPSGLSFVISSLFVAFFISF